MKKIVLVLFLVFIVLLTGCSEKITLDNIENVQTEYKYSKVSINGKITESPENMIITDAKEFANKFISIQFTRAYGEKTTKDNELIMYTDSYKEKNKDILEKDIEKAKDFINKYKLATEVQGIKYNRIINIGGDAFVNAVATVRLIDCAYNEVAQLMGFADGINSNAYCEYNIKMEYIDGEYFIYDYEIIQKDGFLKPLAYYNDGIDLSGEITDENPNEPVEEQKEETEEDKKTLTAKVKSEITDLVNKVSHAQHNRDYKSFKGDEDYKYLSESYKAELNKERDDVKFTKDAYTRFKIHTQFISATITNISQDGDRFVVDTDVKSKIVECLNDEVAKNIGYPGGIGSESIIKVRYIVADENGQWKVTSSKQI